MFQTGQKVVFIWSKVNGKWEIIVTMKVPRVKGKCMGCSFNKKYLSEN